MSRFVLSQRLIVTCRQFVGRLCQSAAKAAYRPCRVTPNKGICFARWQPERRAARCWSRLAGASWLAAQFGARQCSHATAKLHNAALHSVSASQSPKLLLWRPPLRSLRVNATGVMQNCLRWSGRQSSALPDRFAPYAPPPVALVVCWRCGICQALRAWLWSSASPVILCLPPPTPGACFAASPARSARPPPKGAPSARTFLRFLFFYKVSSLLRNKYGGYRPNGL